MSSTPPSLFTRLLQLRPFWSGSERMLPLVLLAIVVGAACEPLIPALMQPLLDQGFGAGRIELWAIPLALIGLFGIRGLAGFVAQYGLAYIANHAMLRLRSVVFDRILQAPVSQLSGMTASGLSNTVVYELQTGISMLVHALLTVAKDALTLVALLGYLLWMNWRLTLIVALVFPAVAWVMKVLSKRLEGLTRASQSATDELAYVVEENVLAQRVVRLHGAQGQQHARFESLSARMRRLALKSTIASASMTPITQILAACALSGVICAALWQSTHQGVTVGSFAAFVTAMLMLIAPIKHLSESVNPITRGLVAVERSLALLETVRPERGGSHRASRAQGRLSLRGVLVRYPDADQAALGGVDLDIEPGETLALVGPSGSGKSTLVNLLPRFIEPTRGEVALDGVSLPEWDLGSLRSQIALVSQDVVMFNESIAFNVALGASPDLARVRAALEAANLWDFVDALAGGMDARVGHNAAQLSGGQRQRLAIARALYRDAPVLLLDEATSALDSESEQAVKQALDRLMQGRTSVVIAHRLSTIENATRIAVLDAGRIVELGSHTQLVRQGGLYARLHQLQTGGGVDFPA